MDIIRVFYREVVWFKSQPNIIVKVAGLLNREIYYKPWTSTGIVMLYHDFYPIMFYDSKLNKVTKIELIDNKLIKKVEEFLSVKCYNLFVTFYLKEFKNGLLHTNEESDHQTAYTDYWLNGHQEKAIYDYHEGKLHGLYDQYAVSRYTMEGHTTRLEYYHYGVLHRDEGPAWIDYALADGEITSMWYEHGELIEVEESKLFN